VKIGEHFFVGCPIKNIIKMYDFQKRCPNQQLQSSLIRIMISAVLPPETARSCRAIHDGQSRKVLVEKIKELHSEYAAECEVMLGALTARNACARLIEYFENMEVIDSAQVDTLGAGEIAPATCPERSEGSPTN
jgi:hypothetical protein